jgi:DNA-binding NtrC family response regulator
MVLKIIVAVNDPQKDILSALEGHDVHFIPPTSDIVAQVSRGNYHLVIIGSTNAGLPDLKDADPRAEVIVIGSNPKDRVELLKNGALAHLEMPADSDKLAEIVDELAETFADRDEVIHLEEQLDEKCNFAGIVGKNPKILDIISFIKRIAPYYKMATITGETGTGKEVVARALHTMSCKPGDPFISSNCAGYVETLIESELFGHQKGSFTGATTDKMGLFEVAREGTLFLDEIGDLPLSFQPHLLRVLQNGEFRPVGSHRVLQARCRIIAATSKNLREEVDKGRFREDLFYRITPIVITVPPLRERKDDIPVLSRHMVRRYAEQTKKDIRGISRPAQDILLSHEWPGNVRELENVINQAVILSPDSFIGPTHFPGYLRQVRTRPSSDGASLAAVIAHHIELVLDECRGNRSRAARKLGISRRALLRKIEKYAISKKQTAIVP